jgi:hypothetical protein
MKKKSLAQAIKAELDRRDPVTYCFIYEALIRQADEVLANREIIKQDKDWQRSIIDPEAWIRSAESIQKLIQSI